MGKPERTVLAIGAGVLALVVVAVIVALTAGSTEAESYAPGSPEAALQAYVDAVRNGDREAALALLSADARNRVGEDDYYPSPYCGGSEDRRVLLDHTDVSGAAASIHLTIQEASSSVFDFDQHEYEQVVPMVQENGQDWKVDDPYVCL